MGLFIGLTFAQDSFQFKKIDSFRKRFDSKYYKSKLLQMTLLPPFRIPDSMMEECIDELEEAIENQFHDLSEIGKIEFSRVDFTTGKKSLLFLKPKMPIDFYHCQESMVDILKSNGAQFKSSKKRLDHHLDISTLLPLGRFSSELHIEEAIEAAREEFSLPFYLKVQGLSLFENTPSSWIVRRRLFTFDGNDQNRYQNELDSSFGFM